MRTVMIESPFEGGTEREADNIKYAKLCMADALRRDEAPYLSHLLYPRLLDDTVPDQRMLGLTAGHAIAARMEAWVFYLDRGVTVGMLAGVDAAVRAGFRPAHEPIDGGSVYGPHERPILFRAFGSGSAEWASPKPCADEIMLRHCIGWPLLLARFEQWSRQNWDLPGGRP